VSIFLEECKLKSKGSVIVIDDEESILSIIEEYLTEKNFKVHKASNGREAYAILKDTKCEVALIDLKLPDCSGLNLVEEFNKKYPGMECVIMTAFASVESTISALRLNVFDYIQKPFGMLVIGEIVEAAYNQNIMIRENAIIIEKLKKDNKKLEDSRSQLGRKVLSTNDQLARANESLKKHVTRLKMLYHMGRDISSNENWDDALDRFLMALCRYLDANGAGLLLFSDGGNTLKPRAYYQLTEDFLDDALHKLLKAQEMDLLQPEIFCMDSCDTRIENCLAAKKEWENTVIPLLFKGRWLGFLVLRKTYYSRMDYLNDYHFINTMQTIFTEEVANAVSISRLRKLKDFNQTILENINSGVLKTDKSGKIIFLNSTAKRIIGELPLGKTNFNDLFWIL
jgi:DNA-binding response OmpR family regulator